MELGREEPQGKAERAAPCLQPAPGEHHCSCPITSCAHSPHPCSSSSPQPPEVHTPEFCWACSARRMFSSTICWLFLFFFPINKQMIDVSQPRTRQPTLRREERERVPTCATSTQVFSCEKQGVLLNEMFCTGKWHCSAVVFRGGYSKVKRKC